MRYHLYEHVEFGYFLVDFSKVDTSYKYDSEEAETNYFPIKDICTLDKNNFIYTFTVTDGKPASHYETTNTLILTVDDYTTITPEHYPELFI